MRLDGKTALITGATSGIGQASAEALAASGAEVLVAGRDRDRADAVVDLITKQGGRARAVLADLRDASQVQRLAGSAAIDILVNNAGIYRFVSTAGTDRATFDEIVEVNIRAPFFLTAALVGAMAERGYGKIINISSASAHVGTPTSALYGGSKGALEAMTRAWAAEFGPAGVNVNAIAPGPTHTPGTAPNLAGLQALTQRLPARRPAEPREIADAVVFLAGNDYLHGATIIVDGGAAAT